MVFFSICALEALEKLGCLSLSALEPLENMRFSAYVR